MTLAELLQPISAEHPGGEDISGDKQFIELTQAIRPRRDVTKNEDPKPDYELVEQLAEELLTKRTKDLQVALFYTEAMLNQHGFDGLRQGLGVLHGLLDTFWDHAYPTNPVQRRGALAKIGSEDFAIRVQLATVSEANHTFWQYRQASSMPKAEEAKSDPELSKRRDAMLADDKLSPEAFAEGVAGTSKQVYKELAAQLNGTLQVIQLLDATSKTRFGEDAPSYRVLRLAVETVSKLVKELLAEKLKAEPDAEPVSASETNEGDDTGLQSGSDTGGRAGATVVDVSDAETRVISAAHYLRKANPQSPTPYLLLRTLRWGELRDGGATLDEKLLIAPRPEMRSQLRSLYIEKRWESLLEATEQIMGSRVGRGWLDLQFYAVHVRRSAIRTTMFAALLSGLCAHCSPIYRRSRARPSWTRCRPRRRRRMRGSRITSLRRLTLRSNRRRAICRELIIGRGGTSSPRRSWRQRLANPSARSNC
jgi:type VI secretion system protein ImpA